MSDVRNQRSGEAVGMPGLVEMLQFNHLTTKLFNHLTRFGFSMEDKNIWNYGNSIE